MFDLTELQYDALSEIFNIGVGHAASALSDILNEEMRMSVPRISFQNRANLASKLCNGENRRICGVRQSFEGAIFNTDAMLMFPEEKSLEIVRLMVGGSLSMQELTEMEQEAMSEIGNIILNACVGVLADMLKQDIQSSLPSYHIGNSDELLSSYGDHADDIVLILHIDIALEKHEIEGHVAFILDMSTIQDLRPHLDQYITEMIG